MVGRHSGRVIKMVQEIIEESETGRPLDSVTRIYFKNKPGLSRSLCHIVKNQVYKFAKWRGCIGNKIPSRKSIEEIDRLIELFKSSPENFPNEILDKAIPAWTRDVMDFNQDWLKQIQKDPLLWVRLKSPEKRDSLSPEIADSLIPASDFLSKKFPLLDGLQESFVYTGEHDLFKTNAFHSGEIEIQDLASQCVSKIANPRPGESWWDTCCGEGGKTMHLCQLMKNKGQVMATDKALWRLKKLKKRAARSKAYNYLCKQWDGLHHRNPGGANRYDGIIIDAPCSGIGTWQRNPDGRWRCSKDTVMELSKTQYSLIKKVVKSLKVGGKLVFSVCTMTRPETHSICSLVETEIKELAPIPISAEGHADMQIWPQDLDCNGMFIKQWQRVK